MNIRFADSNNTSTNNVKANSIENMMGDLDIPINIIDE